MPIAVRRLAPAVRRRTAAVVLTPRSPLPPPSIGRLPPLPCPSRVESVISEVRGHEEKSSKDCLKKQGAPAPTLIYDAAIIMDPRRLVVACLLMISDAILAALPQAASRGAGANRRDEQRLPSSPAACYLQIE